jgi:hypothetical protein
VLADFKRHVHFRRSAHHEVGLEDMGGLLVLPSVGLVPEEPI